MNDLDKAIWQASRGDKPQFIALLTELFGSVADMTARLNALMTTVADHEARIQALESRRGPGRPKGS